jgi:hypothetical protein
MVSAGQCISEALIILVYGGLMIFLEFNCTNRLLSRIESGIENLTVGELLLLSADSSSLPVKPEIEAIEVSEEEFDFIVGATGEPVEPTQALIDLFNTSESE